MKRLLVLSGIGVILAVGIAYVWSNSIRCGIGNAENYDRITPALEKCAAKGNPDAKFWQAVLEISDAETEEEESRAVTLLLKAADAGSMEAMNELGLATMTGAYGLKQDFAGGRLWLERATEQGDTFAPINLARIYAGGYGVEQDLGKALRYVKLSADRGYRNARCVLYILELVETDLDLLTYYMLGYNRCGIWMVPDELFALAPDVVERKYPYLNPDEPNYPINLAD